MTYFIIKLWKIHLVVNYGGCLFMFRVGEIMLKGFLMVALCILISGAELISY